MTGGELKIRIGAPVSVCELSQNKQCVCVFMLIKEQAGTHSSFFFLKWSNMLRWDCDWLRTAPVSLVRPAEYADMD